MNSLLYFDCFAGIAGDMTVAALLSLSGAERELRKALNGLPLPGYRLAVERGTSAGVAGTRVHVRVLSGKGPARHLPEILSLIRASSLPRETVSRAARCFERLGEAEARVHGTTPDKVHFHEVGAVDAIVDVVSGCFLFELLGAPRAFCSALPSSSRSAASRRSRGRPTFCSPAPGTRARS